jgi:hypothetical protein
VTILSQNGLDLSQVKQLVIIPTLALMPTKFQGATAVNLLAGTILVESSGVYLKQLGSGPAMGLLEMEPTTEADCWDNFLAYNPELAEIVSKMVAPIPDRLTQLETNLTYAVAMARIKYYRAPDPLPAFDDAIGLANYHKNFYNTSGGATLVAQSKVLFQEAINA